MNRRYSALIGALAGGACLLASAASAGEIWLTMDGMERHRFDRPVGKVVIANPGVADVQVLSATELLMFGRMPGVTTVSFFDREGARIDEMRVRVGNDKTGTVTLQAGGERYTFACTDRCNQSATLGDGSLKSVQEIVSERAARAGTANGNGGLGAQAIPVRAAPETSGTDGAGS